MRTILLFILTLVTYSFVTSHNPEYNDEVEQEKEITCFIYHRVGDHRYPTTNVSVKDFDAHLDYLVKNNFQILTFSDAIAYLKSDQPARKTAVITIDDGFKSFFKHGLPLLKKYKLPATLFMNTKTVGGGDYMNWEELQTAVDSNIEIGNHTHSHDYFLNEPEATRYETFKAEIDKSQAIIKKHLALVPTVFSYPYGEYDTKMIAVARKAGFIAAAAQNSGVIWEGTDLFLCPRFPMSEAYASRDQFAEKTKAKALRVMNASPDDYIMPSNGRPVLTLSVENTGLQVQRIQTFVQGAESDPKILENSAQKVRISVQARTAVTRRRRTLYTITVPGKNGTWYWYSHLWINSQAK